MLWYYGRGARRRVVFCNFAIVLAAALRVRRALAGPRRHRALVALSTALRN